MQGTFYLVCKVTGTGLWTLEHEYLLGVGLLCLRKREKEGGKKGRHEGGVRKRKELGLVYYGLKVKHF